MLNPMSMLLNTTPLGRMAQAMRGGANPMQVVGQMAQSDPTMRLGYKIISKQGPEGVEKYARNMCRERGINPDDMIRQLGLK